LIGEGAVGKTSIAKRYLKGEFTHEYKQTLGVDIFSKSTKIDIGQRTIRIQWIIWDLAGQPKYKDVRKTFYKGAKGGILVFDVSRKETYEAAMNWANEFIINSGRHPIVLVGNKIDLREKYPDCVTREEGEKLAKILSKMLGYEVPYVESSALKNINIDEIFNTLGRLILSKVFK